MGALNLYALGRQLTDEDRRRAHAFADRAAGAVALAAWLAEQHRVTDDLRVAPASRTTIDQALGILMGQQRCNADQAFDILRRSARNHNRKPRDVAAELIAQVSGVELRPGPTVT